MPLRIVRAVTHDVRFPTSVTLDGSDAMNTDPDYSAAYVVLETNRHDSLAGHGLTFTIGRGTEVCVAAIKALADNVVGLSLEEITADMAGFWRSLVHDSQLRWLGPEKGVIHMAAAALVNAAWDLYAKAEGKPLWKLLSDMTPEQVVACVDFRYIDDVLSPGRALELLRSRRAGRAEREAEMRRHGYPAYTTSAGWLGYSDEILAERARAALAQGFTHVKMKVGAGLDADLRRARVLRAALGPGPRLMMDANQAWSVEQAIEAMDSLAQVDPWWIEEPTSPDDILGHLRVKEAIAPIRVATGEHVANRVTFKQLLQLRAIDVCQIDACRLAGVNEVLAVLLMAAELGVPVCPHAGGVGLCEYVQHLAMFDYVSISGSLEDRVCEYVDHLHEHFVDPCRVVSGRYQAPERPGYSIEMRPESLAAYAFPHGPVWREGRTSRAARPRVISRREEENE
jgi:L-fuconate dehydratase